VLWFVIGAKNKPFSDPGLIYLLKFVKIMLKEAHKDPKYAQNHPKPPKTTTP
jgi:hypothetical protein